MICDEDPLRRRPRESTARRKRQERCVWMARKNDRVAFQARADYQNHAIGWLHRGYSSLGGGKVVRIPRIWMVYGECRISGIVHMLPVWRSLGATALASTVPTPPSSIASIAGPSAVAGRRSSAHWPWTPRSRCLLRLTPARSKRIAPPQAEKGGGKPSHRTLARRANDRREES